VNIVYNIQNVNWVAVAALFAEVNWGQRDPKQLRAAFEKSGHVIFVYDKDELVAFGRTMDDSCYYAMLVDVVVKPSCQSKGLGKTIVDYLRAQLVGYKFVTLTAAVGKDEFYLKLGWQRQKSAMIWPMSDAQREAHAINQQ
jgi:N-acetylglutamate synthase-like GNAT family acetyltransferase